MKVSIILTVYNVGKYLTEAIESALNQTYKNIEIIAVNDGSTDNSAQILELYKDKINIFHQENKGVSGAVNAGLRMVTGDMVAFLDGDDVLVSNKTEKQVIELEKNPELEATFGKMSQFLSPEYSNEAERFNFQKGELPFQSKATLLIRKEAFGKYGLFDEQYIIDFISWFDVAKSKGIVFNQTDDLVVYRRIRENSYSQRAGYYPQLLKFLKDKINQKRDTV